MKVCIAMDSFKESMSSLVACNSVKEGLLKSNKNFEITIVPMADGGEGTMQSLVDSKKGYIIEEKVFNPLFEEIKAEYGIINKDTAIIEMAKASGLELISKERRNPMVTSTYGTGQLILSAINNNVKNIILGIGGSSTNDAGVGMASALGVKFLDEYGNKVNPVGGQLNKIVKIDISNMDKRIKDINFLIACDVDNPLTGENGASYIYAPQKGATSEQVEILDKNLKYFSNLVKQQLNIDCENIKGTGAAGGLGAGSIIFLKGKLKKGIDIVIEFTGLEKYIKESDLVITGEGRIDSQTVQGKTPMGVAKLANKYNKKVIILAGCLGEGFEKVYSNGVNSIFSIINSVDSLDEILNMGKKNLEITAFNLGNILKNLN